MPVLKTVKMLSGQNCGACKTSQYIMDKHSVNYTKYDRDQDTAIAHEFYQKTGKTGIPQFIVTTERNGEVTEEAWFGLNPTKLAALR